MIVRDIKHSCGHTHRRWIGGKGEPDFQVMRFISSRLAEIAAKPCAVCDGTIPECFCGYCEKHRSNVERGIPQLQPSGVYVIRTDMSRDPEVRGQVQRIIEQSGVHGTFLFLDTWTDIRALEESTLSREEAKELLTQLAAKQTSADWPTATAGRSLIEQGNDLTLVERCILEQLEKGANPAVVTEKADRILSDVAVIDEKAAERNFFFGTSSPQGGSAGNSA
ncbi:MAG: hypothetical protein IT428_31460 [Planctomycetaceae bacterium]|nr:hypothetical protein [Planctomycetaceae bacterium]